jgi:5-formyltetrahydrofolate cyclo-ligase
MIVKSELRAELLENRKKFSPEQISVISKEVFGKVEALDCFKNAKYLMVYVTFGLELDTIPFINRCNELGKTVVTPISNSRDHTMSLAITTEYPKGFRAAKMGIMEIPIEEATLLDDQLLDIIIVPGLAFTAEGDRLGYGGGFYDRLFTKVPEKTIKIAPSFDDFIVDELPTNEYDQKVDILLTEKRSIFLSREESQK